MILPRCYGRFMPKLWIDVTELFDQFRFAVHTTGVSRVILNLADRLNAEPGEVFEAARPIFWHPVRRTAFTFATPVALPEFFHSLAARYAAAGRRSTAFSSRLGKAVVTSVPKPFRFRIFPADNGVTLFAAAAREFGLRLSPVDFAPGDCLFVPGSFWLGNYAVKLAQRALARQAVVTAFVHDVLLLAHPEYLPGAHAAQFRRGCESFLPLCGAIACNSAYTASELRRHVRLAPDLPIGVCRLADRATAQPAADLPAPVQDILPRAYVLFVSTITPRKNHLLLVEAWIRLWSELGDATPYLVFVGGGAPDGALAESMARAPANRIIRLIGMTDAQVETLYRHALLTAFPSRDEGFGLPVAESLSRGKVCVAAPSTAIAEIAPDLIDMVDPADPQAMAEKIRHYLMHPDQLAAREQKIKQRYQPTDWRDTSRAVRSVLEAATRARRPASGGRA
jgi:glycosyltransferase involved in cell wall biosynthesis